MNIGIDGYEANISSRVGIGTYAYEILRHLYLISKKHKATVFLPQEPRSDMPKERSNWQYRVVGPTRLWTFIGLPLAIKTEKLDVFFSPTHYIPRFTMIPRVVAIMDLSYLKFPELFRSKDLYQLRNWTAYSIGHARKVLTISKASKNDIIKAYSVPSDRVVVTYPGFIMKAQKPVKTPKMYILSVGTIQPRKNFVRLIEAFSRIRKQYPDLQLLIIGKKGWLYEETFSAPKKFGVEESVKFLDFVSDEKLSAYYKNARCFALPSLYEGFGLPVLEAMTYGTPVVVSNGSSLPEVAGKAGIYVDPQDVTSIVEGLETVLKGGKFVADKIAQGKKQAKKFTWERAAKQTLDVLEHL